MTITQKSMRHLRDGATRNIMVFMNTALGLPPPIPVEPVIVIPGVAPVQEGVIVAGQKGLGRFLISNITGG